MYNKKLVKTLVMLGVIAVVAVTFFMKDSRMKEPSVLDQAVKQGENTVALNGSVINRTEDALYLKTGYFRQEANGNKFIEQEKKVNINSATKIYGSDEVTEILLSEIYTGAVITIYIPIASIQEVEVSPSKIVVDRL